MFIRNLNMRFLIKQGRKTDIKKVIIAGAGASGLFAAYSASLDKNKEVLLIEKNNRPGRKMILTGKGRCNITNDCDIETVITNISSNGKFMYSALSLMPPSGIIDFFNKNGLMTKTERGNRVFPAGDSAREVVQKLYEMVKKNGARFLFNRSVSGIILREGRASGVTTSEGSSIYGDSVILCTGGLSYPATGSSGDGYEIAKKIGHTITELKPGLVPVEICEKSALSLAGLSLRNIMLTARSSNKILFREQGEMLFTHFGLSGPLVLSMSSCLPDGALDQGDLKISIDLKPALDHDTLDKRFLRDFSENRNRQLKNSLNKLYPSKLIPYIIEISGIDPLKETNSITREERKKLIDITKNMELTVKGTRPVSEAIITKGGISLGEVDPCTLESKLCRGLFFAGEILDLDARTGGFNLTIAFSTGYKAGMMS